MPRILSAAVAAAIASPMVGVALFAKIAFADNTYYLFTGVGKNTPTGPPANPTSTFPYGQTFLGMGWLAQISSVPSTIKTQAQNITLTLNGIPPTLVNEAIAQVRVTGTVSIWLAILNSSGTVIQDPVQIFDGSMDVPSLADSGDTSSISITCENALLSLNLAPNRRFDDPDQQLYHPGDLGFSFVDQLPNINLFWPAPANVGSPYPVFMTVTPSPPYGATVVEVGVGGTAVLYATITYSDGSTYTQPGGTGSGPSFVLNLASSNPKIAQVQYTVPTDTVIGISQGQCLVHARALHIAGGGTPTQPSYRGACNVIVHA